MRIGIKSKIFLFTTSLFVVVLILLLLIQSFVIGEFFQRRQQTFVEERVEDLVFDSFESPEPDKELYRLASEYSMMYNTPFVIIDPEKNFFEQIHSPSNTLLVQSHDGQTFNLVIEGFDPEDLMKFENGNWIEFSGFRIDDQNLRVFFLETEEIAIDLESSFRERDAPVEEFEQFMEDFADREIISLGGEILFNNVQSMETQASQKLVGYHGDQIEFFIMDHGLSAFFETDEQRIFDYEDQWTGTKNRLIARPVFFPQGQNYLIIAIVSMSNTESIISIFQEFYWINFIIAIVISFIATYLYAGRFSKPIMHMESIAKDMANMNFDRSITVNSNDEIGSLANSLNMLSTALQDKIVALEDANEKLTDEIEFKTEQEEIRKVFVANVSHELKTPITIMKGIIEGMNSGLYTDPSHLISALDETNRMERLVFDMLEISRYEAKGIELNKSIFSLDESVTRVFRRFKEWTERRNIRTTFHLSEGFISGDQDKMEQVLENLTSNAIRYANENGNIKITIEEKQSSLCFSITNDGTPIPEDSLESIWEPFYRVESSRNRTKGGTGLGLVIVKSILEAHKATFGAMNSDEGVTFWFEIEKISE